MPDYRSYDGTGKQTCVGGRFCPFKSVSGLQQGRGLCPYHWAVAIWGKAWADQCYPGYDKAEAQRESSTY